jgi:hypothetical protein
MVDERYPAVQQAVKATFIPGSHSEIVEAREVDQDLGDESRMFERHHQW